MSCAICRCADNGFCHCSCHEPAEAKAEAEELAMWETLREDLKKRVPSLAYTTFSSLKEFYEWLEAGHKERVNLYKARDDAQDRVWELEHRRIRPAPAASEGLRKQRFRCMQCGLYFTERPLTYSNLKDCEGGIHVGPIADAALRWEEGKK